MAGKAKTLGEMPSPSSGFRDLDREKGPVNTCLSVSVQLRPGVNERNYVAPTWPPAPETVTQTHSFRCTGSSSSVRPSWPEGTSVNLLPFVDAGSDEEEILEGKLRKA